MNCLSRAYLAVAVASALAMLAADAVHAQPPGRGFGGPGRGGPPNATELFERMDKNEDGKLTKDEVPETMWSRLSRAANDDGEVTRCRRLSCLRATNIATHTSSRTTKMTPPTMGINVPPDPWLSVVGWSVYTRRGEQHTGGKMRR